MPDRRRHIIELFRRVVYSRLRRRWRTAGPDQPSGPLQSSRALEIKRLLVAGSPESVLLDTRRGVALIVAYRALADIADKRATTSERLSDQAESAYRRSVVRGK